MTKLSRLSRGHKLSLFLVILVMAWPGSQAFADCCSDPASCVCSKGSLPLLYGGGPVVANPQVYVVYWQMGAPPTVNDPGLAIPVVEGYLRGVGGTQWLNTITQYSTPSQTISISDSLLAGEWYDTADPYDNDYFGEALRAANHFGVGSSPNAIILILDVNKTCDNESSYHHFVAATPPTTSVPIPFIRLAYYVGGPPCTTGVSYLATVLHHELSEAITDPQFDAWLDTNCCEAVDKCVPFDWMALYDPGGTALDLSTYQLPQVWSNEAKHGGGGCVAGYSTHQRAFYTGTDGRLYCRDGRAFGASWSAITDPFGPLVSAPGAVSSATYSVDAFVRNAANGIDRIHTSTTCGNLGWSQWGAPSGWTLVGRPDAASWSPGRLDVVTLAEMGGHPPSIFHRASEHGILSAWEEWGAPLTGPIIASPAVVAPLVLPGQSSYALHVFTINQGGVVWHGVSTDGASLGGWEALPNAPVKLVGDPDAGSWGAITGKGTLEVVVAGSDGAVWRLECKALTTYQCSSGTVTWTSLGHPKGVTLTSPGVVAMGDQRLFVVAKGSSGQFYANLIDFGKGSWTAIGVGKAPPDGRADVGAY
jgi:hypothetical protein